MFEFERVMNLVSGKAGKEKAIRSELARLKGVLTNLQDNLGIAAEGMERSVRDNEVTISLKESITKKQEELEELLR